VGSKYDDYWAGQLPQIRAQVQRAAVGAPAMVSVPDLTRLGARRSWYGVAEVRAQEMTYSSMAHATSLGKTVAANGICGQWPERAFRFTIGPGGDELTITATGDHHRREARPALAMLDQMTPPFRIRRAALALTGVAPTAIRSTAAENVLAGAPAGPDLFAARGRAGHVTVSGTRSWWIRS